MGRDSIPEDSASDALLVMFCVVNSLSTAEQVTYLV